MAPNKSRLAAAAAFYIICVWLAISINYPGIANNDTIWILQETWDVRTLENWHSPFIGWLWSLFDVPFGQPAGILVLHSLLIFSWPAMAIWAGNIRFTNWWAALIGIVLILFFIDILLCLAGLAATDSLLTGLVLAIFAVHERAEKTSYGYNWPTLALALLWLAVILIRPTNLVLPVISVIGYSVFQRTSFRLPLKVVGLAAGILVISLLANKVINGRIFAPNDVFPEQQSMMFDVAGISARTQDDLFISLPGWPANDLPKPWECYQSRKADPFLWVQERCGGYRAKITEIETKTGRWPIYQWWLKAIVTHPIAYLRHRVSFAEKLFTFDSDFDDFVFPPAPEYNFVSNHKDVIGRYSEDARRNIQVWRARLAYIPFVRVASLVFDTWLGIPALWVLFCAGLGGLLFWKRSNGHPVDSVAAIAISVGLANAAMLVPLAASDSRRYLVLTLVCGFVAAIRLILVKSPATQSILTDQNNAVIDLK